MAFSRQLAVVGILGACFFVAVGCGDDDDKKTNDGDAGEGGEGSGGKSQGGSTSTAAGKGGSAMAGTGTAGSGTAGSSTQGGEAGSGGAGTGGSDGNMAGEGGSAVSGAGAGGEAGGAGGATVVTAKCAYACEQTSDCNVDQQDIGIVCDEVTKRCVNPITSCVADADCLPYLTNWTVTCENDGGCFESEACVAVGTVGYCASFPDEETPEFPCLFGAPGSMPRFGEDGNVVVCVSPDPRCIDNTCQPGCADFASGGCGIGNGATCSPTTGLCECATDDECDNGVCGADGRCACVTSDDCQTPGLDVCQDGVCVCGSGASCPDPGFEGATAVCE